MNENDYEVKVKTAKKTDRKLIVLIVCLFIAAAVAIGAIAGFAGYKAGKNNMTVIHSEGGPTASQLSANGTRTISDVVDEVADSVVEINCTVRVQNIWGQKYTATSAGSGVIISEDGTIVTNYHVIAGATKITVRMRDGSELEASVIGYDSNNDIAVIKITADNLTAATFGDSDALKVGQTAIVIGNPLGTLGGTVTDGIISALDRDIEIEGVTMRLLQTNASINSGNSGGGMFDLDGRLVGIVNAKTTGNNVEGLGFAIPANTALEVITKILENR